MGNLQNSTEALTGVSHDERAFVDTRFYEKDLRAATFRHCTFENVHFERCSSPANPGERPDFTAATFRGCSFMNCSLPFVSFDDAVLDGVSMIRCNLQHAHLLNTSLDGSDLQDVDLRGAKFGRTSMRNVRLSGIQHDILDGLRPARRLFWTMLGRQTAGRSIFTAGTEMSPFIAACAREYRLEQLLAEVRSMHPVPRTIALVFMLLFGVISGFGHSLSRWAITSLILPVLFALVYFLFPSVLPREAGGFTFGKCLLLSVSVFLGGAPAGSVHPVVLLEQGCGLIMLGVFVAVLTTKFFQRW